MGRQASSTHLQLVDENRHNLASRQEAVGRQYTSLSQEEQNRLKDVCFIANRPIGPFKYHEDASAFKSHALKLIKNYMNALEEHCGISSMFFSVDYVDYKDPITLEATSKLQFLAQEQMTLGMGQKMMQEMHRSAPEKQKSDKAQVAELFHKLMKDSKLFYRSLKH
jgi:hypothetical protein